MNLGPVRTCQQDPQGAGDDLNPIPKLALILTDLFEDVSEIWSGVQDKHDIWRANREVDVSSMTALVLAERSGRSLIAERYRRQWTRRSGN